MKKSTIRRIGIIIAVAALYAAPQVVFWKQLKQVRYQAAVTLDGDVINVKRYGAVGDGKTDDSSAFARAFDDAKQHGTPIIIPKGTYVVSGELPIGSNVIIRSDGATLKHAKAGGRILTAISADDWSIQGPLTLIGSRTGKGQRGDEIGVYISGCNRFIVDKMTVRDFTGKGIELDGGHPSRAARGDRGKFAFVSFINNGVGMEIDADAKYSAEYNLFTLLSFSGNDVATHIVAGNNVISTSNIVDNMGGVELAAGLNHGHGIIGNSNINHNVDFNIDAKDITNGYTFSGDHVYGDGQIRLSNSKDIDFTGTTIRSPMVKQ